MKKMMLAAAFSIFFGQFALAGQTNLLDLTVTNPSSMPRDGQLASVKLQRDGTVIAVYVGRRPADAPIVKEIAALSGDRLLVLKSSIEKLVPADLVNPKPNPVVCLACSEASYSATKEDGTVIKLVERNGRGTSVRTDGLGAEERKILDGFFALAAKK